MLPRQLPHAEMSLAYRLAGKRIGGLWLLLLPLRGPCDFEGIQSGAIPYPKFVFRNSEIADRAAIEPYELFYALERRPELLRFLPFHALSPRWPEFSLDRWGRSLTKGANFRNKQ